MIYYVITLGLPVTVLALIAGSFLGCFFMALFTGSKNGVINLLEYFFEITQVQESSVMPTVCASTVLCVLISLAYGGIENVKWYFYLWYLFANFFAALHVVYVVDYHNQKSKGLTG